MKSLALYIIGNIALVVMWIASLLAQVDNSIWGLGASVATLIAAAFSAVWFQLWRGQTALLEQKDKLFTHEEALRIRAEEKLDNERKRNHELEEKLDQQREMIYKLEGIIRNAGLHEKLNDA